MTKPRKLGNHNGQCLDDAMAALEAALRALRDRMAEAPTLKDTVTLSQAAFRIAEAQKHLLRMER